jgi:hypothetical protein
MTRPSSLHGCVNTGYPSQNQIPRSPLLIHSSQNSNDVSLCAFPLFSTDVAIASDTLENRVDELLQKEEVMLMDKKVVWRRGSAEVIINGIRL